MLYIIYMIVFVFTFLNLGLAYKVIYTKYPFYIVIFLILLGLFNVPNMFFIALFFSIICVQSTLFYIILFK